MYNGIGLATARGSGTNGHVQRNLSFVRQGKKDNVKYKNESDLTRAEVINNRQPNEDILEHERKRKIEVKVLEFEEILEEQDDLTPDEIALKVQTFREKLLGENEAEQLPKDEFGRYAVRETHQVAAAKHEKNAMLRSAFGISEYFVEGSSFDADRKAKEELAKSAALQKEMEAQRAVDAEKSKRYRLVRTPSVEKEITNDNADQVSKKSKEKSSKSKDSKSKRKKNEISNDEPDKKRKKKKKKADSSDSSLSSNEEPKAKKSQRKRKKSSSTDSSSDSPSDSEPAEKRKKRNKNNDKKKQTNQSKKSKKHRRHSTSSSSSDSSSSSSSFSSSSNSSESDSHQKRKHRRK